MLNGIALLMDEDTYRRDALVNALCQRKWAAVVSSDVEEAEQYLSQTTFDALIFNLDISPASFLKNIANHLLQNSEPIVVLYNKYFDVCFTYSYRLKYGLEESFFIGIYCAIQQVKRRYARVRFLARRQRLIKEPSLAPCLPAPSLLVHRSLCQVSVAGRIIPLSQNEMELLLFVIRSPRQTASFFAMAETFYAGSHFNDVRDLLKNRVYRLRQKIEPDPDLPCIFCSQRGFGLTIRSVVTFVEEFSTPEVAEEFDLAAMEQKELMVDVDPLAVQLWPATRRQWQDQAKNKMHLPVHESALQLW